MSSTECPHGFRKIDDRFCFAKGNGKKTFEAATKDCENRLGFLAEPRSQVLINAMAFFHHDFRLQPFFIGLKDFNNLSNPIIDYFLQVFYFVGLVRRHCEKFLYFKTNFVLLFNLIKILCILQRFDEKTRISAKTKMRRSGNGSNYLTI